MSTVTLIDGTEVHTDDPRWRDECLARQRHIDRLRRLHISQRPEYFDNVGYSEGREAEARLRQAYTADFHRRKAALASAASQAASTQLYT